MRLSAAFLALTVTACVDGPQQVFDQEALRVLEGRCASSSCHGVGPGAAVPEEGLYFRLDDDGLIADASEARAQALTRVTTEVPEASTLLRRPMPAWADGGPHAGGAAFTGTDDPAAQALVRWIRSEAPGSGGEDLVLTDLEERFAADVLPVLARRCGFAGCHGPTELANSVLTARAEPATGRFAPPEIRAAYRNARKHLDLWSADPKSARLLRKAIGALAGGLPHRGGEQTFFPEAELGAPLDAEGAQAILSWARAEREALGVVDGQAPTALLFVAGPPSPRAPYRIEAGPTGSDLFRTSWPPAVPPDDAPDNLTAALHPEGEAELRDPAVSHDGTRAVVAMRRQGEPRFSLWEIGLDDGAARRVTPDDDPGSYVQPTYAADGRIVAAWDGHGEVGADGDGVAPELVAIDPDGVVSRLTWTPAPEMSPSMLASGKTRGELVFATRRAGGEGVLFRFPLCHDPDFHGEPEYHVQLGASLSPLSPLSARDLPDGRQVMIVLDSTAAADDRGRLALLDRSMGPFLLDGLRASASIGGYRSPIAWLSDDSTFRDPSVLPDGRVLVSTAAPSSPGRDAIYVAAIEDGPDGTVLGALELVRDEPGLSLRSPVAVFARPPEDDDHVPVIDPSRDHGFFELRDVAVLESIYGRVPPWGPRPLRDDIAAVRLVRWDGVGAGQFSRDYADGGSTLGLSPRAPSSILAEHELPADRSAWFQVPARTPILLQWVDRRGMIVGNQLDRWFYAEGDETIPAGTNAATYAHDCTGCHGAASGRSQDATTAPPDAISAASVTLSTHADRDRRRPLPPVEVPRDGRSIDYLTDVEPRFVDGCGGTECHGGSTPAADLPLDRRPGGGRFGAAYEALVVRYVDRGTWRARRSALVERLLGEELEAPSPVTGACPPGGADEALVRLVAGWIELGALYDASAREAP